MTERVQNAMLRHWASMLNAKGFYEWSPEAEAAVQEMAASYLGSVDKLIPKSACA